MKDKNSLSHTSYRCKYRIAIVSKYRRMIIDKIIFSFWLEKSYWLIVNYKY